MAGRQPKDGSADPNRSRVVLRRDFGIAGHLTTIQLTDTILFEPNDSNRGAWLFAKLMAKLLAQAPSGNEPVLIWLAMDIDPLRHVVSELKSRDPNLFDQIADHAIYGKADPSAPFYEAYRRNRRLVAYRDNLALTASAVSSDGSNPEYAYHGHFSPEACGEDWSHGPHCTSIRRAPKPLKRLVRDLHSAHNELVQRNKKDGDAIKKLAAEGIIISRLAGLLS